MKTLLAILIIAIFVSACGAGPHSVKEGTAFNYITNLEVRADNTYVIWLLADSSFAYCFGDKAMYDKAQSYMLSHKLVVMKYRTINDNEQGPLSTWAGCTRNSDKDVVMEYMLSIDLSSGQ